METIEYNFIDKSNWPMGPWQQEPDKLQWQDEITNLPCLIVRNHNWGFLCGYVGISKSHPYFGKDYDDCNVNCHGGLTFSGKCRHSPDNHGICHIVAEGEDDDVWWLGFDCGHCYDLIVHRQFGAAFDSPHDTYRDWDYVREQVRSLAKQLKEIGG